MRSLLFFLGVFTIGLGYSQNDLNFKQVTELVKEFDNAIVLSNKDSRLLVSSFQSQVISSSANGDLGYSYGWLNSKAMLYNKENRSTFFYGGEDRFWLNPLGSKYTLFYGQKQIKPEHWEIPKLFEEEVFDLKFKDEKSVIFQKKATIKNNIGTIFSLLIERDIKLFSREKIKNQLKIKDIEKLKVVGFGSKTTIRNIGENWNESKGIVTPWTLGMFKGGDTSVGVFPFVEKKDSLKLSKYFLEGKEKRWVKTASAVLFKTDGSLRSKIGLPMENSTPFIGNYDYKNQRLTIIQFSFNEKGKYLSSKESNESYLYGGDVVNSYNNDGEGDKPTFFELETTAPGRILKKNESITHIHYTYHFEGDFELLNKISKKVLNSDLKGIEKNL